MCHGLIALRDARHLDVVKTLVGRDVVELLKDGSALLLGPKTQVNPDNNVERNSVVGGHAIQDNGGRQTLKLPLGQLRGLFQATTKALCKRNTRRALNATGDAFL